MVRLVAAVACIVVVVLQPVEGKLEHCTPAPNDVQIALHHKFTIHWAQHTATPARKLPPSDPEDVHELDAVESLPLGCCKIHGGALVLYVQPEGSNREGTNKYVVEYLTSLSTALNRHHSFMGGEYDEVRLVWEENKDQMTIKKKEAGAAGELVLEVEMEFDKSAISGRISNVTKHATINNVHELGGAWIFDAANVKEEKIGWGQTILNAAGIGGIIAKHKSAKGPGEEAVKEDKTVAMFPDLIHGTYLWAPKSD